MSGVRHHEPSCRPRGERVWLQVWLAGAGTQINALLWGGRGFGGHGGEGGMKEASRGQGSGEQGLKVAASTRGAGTVARVAVPEAVRRHKAP